MGTNLHKDLTDAQLHVPKGFSTASNSTVLTKDSGGSLVWATDSHSGQTDKRLSMTFSGQLSAKTAGNYGREYAREMSGFINSTAGGVHWTGTITPIMATNSAVWVVPADCTIETLIARATSTSVSLLCKMKLYAYRYDCSTTLTTISEHDIVTAIDNETIDADEILCVEKTSFTTSHLSKGDLIVFTLAVDLATSEYFNCQGTMMVKLD